MKKDRKSISVVIAAFNEEHYLPRVLSSLKRQTRKPDEILVVDNNSTDQTAKIAKSFGAKVVAEKKAGYVHALSRGLNTAKGEILAVTDADTTLPPRWLEVIEGELANEQVVAVTGPLHYESESPIIRFLPKLYTLFLNLHFWFNKPHMTGTSMAFRKSAFEKIGGVNTVYDIGADVELGLRLKKHGKVKLVHQLGVLASHRRWEKNASKSFSKYAKAYFATVWFSKPAKGSLSIVR